MALGEVFISSILGGLFNALIDRMSSQELLEFLKQEGFDKKIKRCQNTLWHINSLLRDADENQQTGSLKKWLEDLEDLAYDAEDMLDEFEFQAISRKVKIDQLRSRKFLKHIPADICSWTPDAIRFHFCMRSQVNHVTCRFEELCELRGKLGLQVCTREASSSFNITLQKQKPPTSGHQTEPTVYGRGEDKKKILEMVLNEPTDHSLFMISILGMGGVGKTILTQEVFMALKDEFDVRVWVCVSDGEFQVTKISKSILENITGSSFLPNELATIHDQIVENLNGKKLLIIFDDVWSADYHMWQTVISPLRASAAGSRIIITTRHEVVASTLRSDRIHSLDFLQPGDCWSIVLMHIKNEAIHSHPDRELIREKVCDRTKGLPLAAATLGGILHSEHIDVWLKILNDKLWDLSEQGDNQIPEVLKLSYYHLPYYLKRCFSYCSLFPKDHSFQKEELVFLWIAAGLIQPSSTKEEKLEELGCRYFSNLLGRCLFQRSSGNDVERFTMHDLVHDLAIWAFGEGDQQSGRSKKARHFSYVPTEYDDEKRFQLFQNVEGMKSRTRTFLPILQSKYDFTCNSIAESIVFELLPKLKRLRILSLQGYQLTRLPILVGRLKHLRYINFSYTRIESLPQSISMLYNLQFLILSYCSSLKKLPSNFKYLLKLRHFDLEGSVLIKEMPLGIKVLKDLLVLSLFVVGEDGKGSDIKDLKGLKKLRGKLCITGLSNVISCGDCGQILRDKEHLEELLLVWESTSEELPKKLIDEHVLFMLQPHEKLQRLTIQGYGGREFSSWVGAASYSSMKVLELNDCEKCESLPPLGALISLEKLAVKRMKSLKSISREFYGKARTNPFKSLKSFCFEDLPVWTDLELVEGNECGDPFPCLLRLSMVDCPQLSGSLRPQCFAALENLNIKNCKQLVVSFSSIPPKLSKMVIDGCKTIECDHPEEGFKSIRYLELSGIADYRNGLIHECFRKPVVEKDKGISRSDEICPLLSQVGELRSLRFLTELFISEIGNMVSFPEVCSLPHLRILRIKHFNALISLPREMETENKCLESIKISHCDSLQLVVSGHFPPSLKTLWVSNCEKLKRLWDDSNTNSSVLEVLTVYECHSLTSLSSIFPLPSSLKEVHFRHCQQITNHSYCHQLTAPVKTFLDSSMSIEVIEIRGSEGPLPIPNGLQNLMHLKELSIGNCQNMEYFPVEGLANNTYLRKLCISDCLQLKALPNGLRSLKSLEKVYIQSCPSVSYFDPGEVFPTNIKFLFIENCVNVYLSLVDWGLQNLNSLTSLKIWGFPDVESFPLAEMEVKLPSSLTHLEISDGSKLKKLQGLQQVTSLQSLTLANCSELASLGDGGLPSSLHILLIWNCPKLEKECKRSRGTEWPKISNIPMVWINYKPIFVIEEEDEEAKTSSWFKYAC